MGLDMYLYGVKESLKDYSSKYDNGTKTRMTFDTVRTEEMYWRKCYFVDDWIIQNVQNGVNDCNYHVITLDDLRELKSAVEKMLNDETVNLDDYNEYWFRYTVMEINRLESNFEKLGYDRLEYRNSW